MSGEKMPLNAEPAEDGNQMIESEHGRLRVYPWQPTLWDESPPKYRPHFADCPDAARWRTGMQST